MPSWKRIARPIRGAVERFRAPQDDEAFVDATREAYRAAARDSASSGIEPNEIAEGFYPAPDLLPPGAKSGGPAERSDLEPGPSTAASVPTGLAAQAPDVLLELTPALAPFEPPSAGATQDPLDPGSRPTDTEGDLDSRPRPGNTAPERLLHAPVSVTVATDRFLDGLARGIEGDR